MIQRAQEVAAAIAADVLASATVHRAAACAALLVATGCASGQPQAATGPSGDMLLATTTSTQDTGLLDELVPAFESGSACTVKTVAVGSGEAMAMGEQGNADVLLAHSPDEERRFMAQGHGSSRAAVMHNDFVLVGPPADPAGVGEASDAAEALRRIARAHAPFASRADDSGTHTKELDLWHEAGIDPQGPWYVETGQGMGATLTIANQKQAYTLADRGTFLATAGLHSGVVFEGSDDLLNPYHVIVVDHAGTNTDCAREFSGWLRQGQVQRMIGRFGLAEYGEALFHPDAG
jgi:tungstate transport system substrate-binding protein